MHDKQKRSIRLAPILTLLLTLVAGVAMADKVESAKGFESLLQPYETARQALVSDSLEGIAEAGNLLAERAAGIEDGGDLLIDIEKAALDLAGADDLETARDAFYELSKPLVRYRKAAGADEPVVAYCSMSKRSWLQPKGEIGNPYHGQAMPKCGEVVDG